MSEGEAEAKMRTFESGATRNLDHDKYDYEGFLSPSALERYAQYMHEHRLQADGKLRDSDNWQKGIPIPQYMKSMWRHLVEVWKYVRSTRGDFRAIGDEARKGWEDALCAVIFNTMGMLHELRKPQS